MLWHQIPVRAGLIKVSFDCATAATLALLTDEALDDFREPVRSRE